MWYEIKTGTVECVDEVASTRPEMTGEDADEFAGIGAIEEAAPDRKTRLNVGHTHQSDLLGSFHYD